MKPKTHHMEINPEGCLLSDETLGRIWLALNAQKRKPGAVDALSASERKLYETLTNHLTFRAQLVRVESRDRR